MATVLDGVRVEVAFSTDPNTTSPAFVDLTSRARLDEGITITRGRQDEMDAVSAGQCSLTFDNTDGALTPGLSSSPFYPNVRPQNRIRVSYRDPSADGNLLSVEDASYEGGTVGAWVNTALVAPNTIANSAARAQSGTKSVLVTWGTGGALAQVELPFSGTVVGRTYTASIYVYIPTGSPAVKILLKGVAFGTTSAVTNTFTRLSVTWTATTNAGTLAIQPATAPTAGQQVWLDAAQLDEGSTPGTFTTSAAPISYRFDGYIDEWPTEWPTGGQTESTTSVSAVDLQSRIGRKESLGSVIAETYKFSNPLWHFPLSEPESSTSVGDRIGTGSTLSVAQVGTGGELTFAAGTGPGVDGSGAPLFAPASVGNGKFLAGSAPLTYVYPDVPLAVSLEICFAATVAADATIARWSDPYGTSVNISLDASGHLVGTLQDSWRGTLTVTSSSVAFANGATHTALLTLEWTGTTNTLKLYGDGALLGTSSVASSQGYPNNFATVHLGGTPAGRCFTGTLSHAAAFLTALPLATATEHYEAASTGFAGERSDERISRIASWVGLPAGLLSLDVGASQVAHVDPTGRNAWDYMQDVATTESGTLFVSTDGRLTFYNRIRSYATDAAPTVTVAADVIDPSTRIVNSLANVVNDVSVSREGGATVRKVDADSVKVNGVRSGSLSIISFTDSDAVDRASWILATRSRSMPRLPELGLDGLAEPSTSAAVRSIDIYSRVAVTGMPSQSDTATKDLRVQGYRESISDNGWDVTANTTPYLLVKPLTLDDPVYGLLDANSLVF